MAQDSDPHRLQHDYVDQNRGIVDWESGLMDFNIHFQEPLDVRITAQLSENLQEYLCLAISITTLMMIWRNTVTQNPWRRRRWQPANRLVLLENLTKLVLNQQKPNGSPGLIRRLTMSCSY
jgi:hypothetical protein